MVKGEKVTKCTKALVGMVMFIQVLEQLALVTDRQVKQGIAFDYFSGPMIILYF